MLLIPNALLIIRKVQLRLHLSSCTEVGKKIFAVKNTVTVQTRLCSYTEQQRGHLELATSELFSGSEIRNQAWESIWILLVEFCKNPWILTMYIILYETEIFTRIHYRFSLFR